uniref:Uncharacterized protein n=1 Tax=Klebsiella pneumoniae subsp. pneumoniae TaxID=72407 RepID=A0A1D9N9I9_KLEPN|nr:hypothetical protein A7K74_51 [Klebsiella pneumoniae subsp. pneumoniae]
MIHRAEGLGEGEWKVKKHGQERRRIWRNAIWQLTVKTMNHLR